ncbi:hypothetical protein GCM10011608_10420 [Micromonospora sonchi]|uniref:Uncharacterized protein n=1 Tax=Micromonospora sonchi TaxID=1763543 RepID=A0A917TM85_9ACTN|nr:hypothetical protein [Micromonospora sonchi]GGM27529.1 hypothetical protein GCM10011608_10420 [Micromonospora sonchi]
MNDNSERDWECDGYPEHTYRTTYEGPDGWQGVCSRCGAEDWVPTDGSEES